MPRTYLAADVCALAGCTYRQLDYWCRRGLVPGHAAARGSGHHRRFTAADVELVRRLAAVSADRRRPLAEMVV